MGILPVRYCNYKYSRNTCLVNDIELRKCFMLRFTDMTLEEIAIAVGMNGGNYFSWMFKKIEGISPREYRKQW